jgi:PAS domain-containing protein
MVAVVGLALALGRDERKTLLRQLQQQRQTAADQATLLGTIVNCMHEGLTVVDEQGRFLLRNPAVRDLLGGVVEGVRGSGVVAELDPAEGRCCVVLRRG